MAKSVSTTSSSSTITARASERRSQTFDAPATTSEQKPPSQIPVTPAVLRNIFSSARTPFEERSISRIAFFRFTGFLLSCVGINLTAAALLGT